MILKKLLLLLAIAFFVNFYAVGQIKNDVKNWVDEVSEELSSVPEFAALINYKFIDDIEKIGAIYYWMANNINFDTKAYFSKNKKTTYNFRYRSREEMDMKIQKIDNEIVDRVFKKKIGLSREYALLFKKLCNNSGIQCEVVEGFIEKPLKLSSKKALKGKTKHVWNAVCINNDWYAIDVSLAAGKIEKDKKKFISAYCESYYLYQLNSLLSAYYPRKKSWTAKLKPEIPVSMILGNQDIVSN